MLGLPMAAAFGRAGIHVIAARGRWQARAQGQGQGGFDPSGRPGDHYRALGVSPSASPQDIKTAFRQRALQFHPDVSKEVGAGDKFKHIRLAYEILSDEAKRSEYDHQLVGGGRRNGARKGRVRVRRSYRGQYRRVVYQAPVWSYDADAGAGGQGREEEAGEEFCYQETKGGDRNSGSRKQDFDKGQVLLAGVWAVAVAWHAFGAQVASTLLVAGMALSKQVAVGYRIASGVALLIGRETGLLVAVSAALATMLFGKPQGTALAVIAIALWLGGSFMQTMPLPPGAVLVTAYKCIELQAQLEEARS